MLTDMSQRNPKVELQHLLGGLLGAPNNARLDEASLTRFHELLRSNPGDVTEAADSYLADNSPAPVAAGKLLDLEAARGITVGSLNLADRLVRHFGRDERFLDIRLRFQLALGQREALLVEIRDLIELGYESVQLAYRILLSLQRAADGARGASRDLFYRAIQRFLTVVVDSPESDLWLGRYYREVGNNTVALKHYAAAWDELPETNRFRVVALREAVELALSGDHWGRDAPILLRAWGANLETTAPWRSEAVAKIFDYVGAGNTLDANANLPGTNTYSHLYSMIETPETAFNYLLDEVLPTRAPYDPDDMLLMVGTSLSGGGMERIFANSYRAVSSAGTFSRVRMALLTFEADATSAFYLPETGASADEIEVLSSKGSPEFPISLLPTALARRVWDAYRLIIRERPRIIHAWNDLPGIVAAFAGLLAGCPQIFIHFHHMRAINLSTDRKLVRSYPACYRRLLERPEIELLFVADACANDYADWWSVERSAKFRKLFNGFAEPTARRLGRDEAREALGLPREALVVGTVFRFHPVKRPLLWIDAARVIHRALPGVHFVMVGDGALMEEARARVSSYQFEELFHFPGHVKNVADYLACFDLFMLTSESEGLPNSLVEAQLAGVPVLSTDVGGASETFSPGVTGRLVKAATAEAIGEAAVDCLTDDQWRHRAQASSREIALQSFSIDCYVENLLHLYGSPAKAMVSG
jgi:glycosyltransferase involved in cell wall biosynthesis